MNVHRTSSITGMTVILSIGLIWGIGGTLLVRSDTSTGNDMHSEMPVAFTPSGPPDEERKLFLTPGGLYTQADIDANGDMTPTQKFQGIGAMHNMHPAPGDRICPITNTLANPKFTWIVGGKAYMFCCPPCVREFVIRAKTKPKSIQPPEAYVQR